MGELVKRTRERHKLSQERLAKRAGTSQAAVWRIEEGKVSPGVETLRRLFLAMGEEMVVDVRPLDHGQDPVHLKAVRELSPDARVERAAGFGRLAFELRGAARERPE